MIISYQRWYMFLLPFPMKQARDFDVVCKRKMVEHDEAFEDVLASQSVSYVLKQRRGATADVHHKVKRAHEL